METSQCFNVGTVIFGTKFPVFLPNLLYIIIYKKSYICFITPYFSFQKRITSSHIFLDNINIVKTWRGLWKARVFDYTQIFLFCSYNTRLPTLVPCVYKGLKMSLSTHLSLRLPSNMYLMQLLVTILSSFPVQV